MTAEALEHHSWVPAGTTFGSRLALLRQVAGWGNVKEAAEACGVPVTTWRTWERGRTPRDVVTIARRLSAVTGCDYHWLLDGTPGVGAIKVERGSDKQDLRVVDAGVDSDEVAPTGVDPVTFRFSVGRSTN